MARLGCCLVFVALFGGAAAAESGITPIEKVVQLMDELLAKGEAEKKDEAVKFSAFNEWCGNQDRIKGNEIKAANNKIAELTAQIEKGKVEIRDLTARIEELEEDVGRWKQDEKSASAVREKERVDFQATNLDYSESLSALGQAIEVMKGASADKAQAARKDGEPTLVQESLLQVQRLALIPASAKSALTMFLQQPDADMPDDQLFIKAPEADAYSFQSSGVVDMLEKLEDEFRTKKTELEQDEMNAQNGFEKIMQQLADNQENANHEISKKTKLRAETEQVKADNEGEKAQTIADRDEDQKYLDDTNALCQQKSSDFAARQQLRGEEIAAVQQARDIIASDKVAGSGDKHLPAMLQIKAKGKSALAQMKSNDQSPIQQQIAAFLAERARLSGSRLLADVSARVAANPFTKVKKMIHDLIIKLQEEGTSETEHKGWCDTELTTNKQSRDKKTADVNTLTAEAEDLTAQIAQLTQDIADLAAGIQELDTAMSDMTTERFASKAKNEQTISDAKVAQTAVEQALAILKDFYAKSAQATAFAQGPAEDAPETFEKPYKGLLPEGGSIADFLEVILSDFARLESETTASEATEADEYSTYMFESKKDKALKENEQGHKSEKKTDQEGALHATQEELKATQDELGKAIAYYEKLKPTCVDSGISYEERVKRREEEMQSLQEALGILKGSDIA